METRQIAQQMINFQKSFFNSSFTTMASIQDYTQNAMAEQAGKVPWVTEEGKKSVNEMCAFMQQCRDSFKKSVDEGYIRLEEMIAGNQNTTTN